jgi:hypothetical protein
VFSELVCAPASRSAANSALRRDLSVARFFAKRAASLSCRRGLPGLPFRSLDQ